MPSPKMKETFYYSGKKVDKNVSLSEKLYRK